MHIIDWSREKRGYRVRCDRSYGKRHDDAYFDGELSRGRDDSLEDAQDMGSGVSPSVAS